MAIKHALLVLLLLFSGGVSMLQAETVIPVAPPRPLRPLVVPPPSVKAKAYLLMDAYSSKVLVGYNVDQPLPPASLTKMMTVYVISRALQQGRIHMDDLVPISQTAWRTGGSKMFVKVDTHVSVRDLIQGIVVASGNDACVAMAEYVAGSQESFVAMMNQEAQRLGMTNTHFTDVNGLPDPKHYSSARDMAILARALIFDFPQDYQWHAQKWFTFNGIRQPNRNRLLWQNLGVDGIKTGHTDEAGYCLVVSARQTGMRLISVIMGAPSDQGRMQDSQKLLTYGFRFFETRKFYSANKPIAAPTIRFGSQVRVAIGTQQDFYVTFPIGQYNNIKTTILLTPQRLQAPVQVGQIVAQLTLSLNGEHLGSTPLVALEAVPKGSLWQRLFDYIGFTALIR